METEKDTNETVLARIDAMEQALGLTLRMLEHVSPGMREDIASRLEHAARGCDGRDELLEASRRLANIIRET